MNLLGDSQQDMINFGGQSNSNGAQKKSDSNDLMQLDFGMGTSQNDAQPSSNNNAVDFFNQGAQKDTSQ